MTYNVTDDELNANYEPEVIETFLDRRLKRQREKPIVKCVCHNIGEAENCDRNCERYLAEMQEQEEIENEKIKPIGEHNDIRNNKKIIR